MQLFPKFERFSWGENEKILAGNQSFRCDRTSQLDPTIHLCTILKHITLHQIFISIPQSPKCSLASRWSHP